MFKTLRDAWKVKEIRNKMLYTLFCLFIFRLGSHIPAPFIDKTQIAKIFESAGQSVLGFLDLMAGGSLSNMSIFAMNIYPYITASIIIQLLTVAIPKLEELAKEGEEGRRKLNSITRITGVVLALIQSMGTVFGLYSQAVTATGFIQNSLIIITLVAGTSFLVWLGDRITENGVGNGISLIIFVGIVARLPETLMKNFRLAQAGVTSWIAVIIYLLIMVAIVAFVVIIQEGERRIPVQYAKRVVGRRVYGGQATHIPIKVNMASVMPVIFASTFMQIPATIALFSKGGFGNFLRNWLTQDGKFGFWIYLIINFVLIIFFTYFYNAIQFNTVEYAKNIQSQGGFIPGIRPGKPTSQYLSRTVNRITFIGGLALAILSTLPLLLSHFSNLDVAFQGTGMIIVVGVALETVKQIEAQMTMRHYKGFLG
ncbi:MAG: preprotein translocase subunit SecY [Ezakiella sp.]|uniref:preprotein translocase subunit SecY n=1 Tax=Ezakiella sp. TaxID=1935205 RepID=UPI002975AE90|nr:preprotein translocase subunit SecY [Ezakiella sp.]MDD7731264.1 preprotein translocase subunit SecY [Eubacteriales bacterium]MDY6079133.1 preprotein translocase subunit SecY [Ezakiella sp.]